MEQEKLNELIAENNTLKEKLTKRNEQYIFSLTKALDVANLSEERQTVILNDTLKPLVDGQKSGQTARQLFGTVTEYTTILLSSPGKPKGVEGKSWMYMVDGGLLMTAMMCLVSAMSGFFNKNSQGTEMGLLSLIMVFLLGGAGVLLITRNMPDRRGNKKGSIIRYLLVSTAVILVWAFAMGIIILAIPQSINPTFSAPVYAILGIGLFAGKIYLKKKWNLQNTFM